jgi:GntR family transcriptional repressor for pyruvate dehydrogenase complex
MLSNLPRVGSQPRHAEQIYWLMVDWLADSGARPGTRLPTEVELAEQFGVSRPTMREAILALKSAGLVEPRRGRNGGLFAGQGAIPQVIGTLRTLFIIGDRSRENLREARAIIEVGVARLAAERITDQQLEELARSIEQMATDQSVESIQSSNKAFHMTIANAVENEILRSIMIALHSLVAEVSYHAPDEFDTFRMKLEGHREIYAALENRDPDDAARAMRKHLQTMANQSRKLYGPEGERLTNDQSDQADGEVGADSLAIGD